MMTQDFLGHIRDLAGKTRQNAYLTHTEFLSASELSDFYTELRRLPGGLSANRPADSPMDIRSGTLDGVPFLVYGGHSEAERNVLCFLPDWLSPEDFLTGEAANGEVLKMLRVEPVNRRFAEDLSHRDFLGALMNLGIERNRIGDILVSDEESCIFVLASLSGIIAEELTRVKHTSVRCTLLPPGECGIAPRFQELGGSVASCRLDALLAMVFSLSRGTAQTLIERELAAVNGGSCLSAGHVLQPGDRVSLRGYGKFIFDGEEKRTKKGRLYVHCRRFV